MLIDMLIIGKREQIQEFATLIQKEFSVKIQHNLVDYLGCEFHMNKEKTKGWLGQLSIIKKSRTEIWGNSHEGKAVNYTWDPKIHCEKIGV